MTKKQVLFWRIILILIIVLIVYFISLRILENKNNSIDQAVKVEKGGNDNKDDEKIVEKEIELNIRLDDFYKEKTDKN